MAYDSRCFDVALMFVQDVASENAWSTDEIVEKTHELAQLIQDAIEGYLNA